MRFFTLIHIAKNEKSIHNNGFVRSFDDQINLYLTCARQLHQSLKAEGFELIILTNDVAFLQRLNVTNYPVQIIQLEFLSSVPSQIKFYSAHFKLEVFKYLSSLADDYLALVDSDMLCINKMPAALQTCMTEKIPVYYDITDQVTPAHGAETIIADKERISKKSSVGLWAGGEFIAGPPSFFQQLYAWIEAVKPSYMEQIDSFHHQGDEVLSSVAIESMKRSGVQLMDGGTLAIVARYWSFVPLHVQKGLNAFENHFLLHLPSDKKFLSKLQPNELKAGAFFKKYKRHLVFSRTIQKFFKSIKPYAKRLRKSFSS